MSHFVVKRSGNQSFKVGLVSIKEGRQVLEAIDKSSNGFSPTMTLEEAREHAKRLNKDQQTLRRARAQKRAEQFVNVEAACLPPDLISEFESWLKQNRVTNHNKAISHWNKAKAILKEFALLPPDFTENKRQLLSHFTSRQFSLSYTRKVLSLIDDWGRFYCRRTKTFYEPLGKLGTLASNDIEETYLDSDRFIGASEPLTPILLMKLKDYLKPEQYKWLFVSVYFGLRPSEVNGKHRIEYDRELGFDVLHVYQSKLRRLKREERWKMIPAFLPEQKQALEFIKEGNLQRPLVKTLKRYSGKHLTLYGGRKGFEQLMLTHGRSFEELSSWLGHANVDRTWRDYRNKKKVRFSKVG